MAEQIIDAEFVIRPDGGVTSGYLFAAVARMREAGILRTLRAPVPYGLSREARRTWGFEQALALVGADASPYSTITFYLSPESWEAAWPTRATRRPGA